ncbi:MAG TPA: Type 1 glutamine amidotransferase-like domain-containing protein [Myxococcaceae bacterium]|nr:Type 1 glutamine amidotransferase-like domain-containing protein [Myxococcaceae bacterium]
MLKNCHRFVPSILAAVALFIGTTAEAKVTRYLTGSSADVSPTLYGPALNLGGGGTDVDPALQWMIDQARGCTTCATKVDVVIVRASGSNGYNAPVYAMSGVDSVETLVIPSARDASDAAAVATIRNAEVVFFAGGDQCNYVSFFRGTGVQSAVQAVYARGGAVGGTSAGAMIQGEHIYDACTGSVYSSEALADPYNRYMSLSGGLFPWAPLANAVVDTHFGQRDRMGRLMTFVARRIQDGHDATVLGIGINEATSLVIDRTGYATVMGQGPVYFVQGTHQPERCVAAQSLSYSDFRVWKVTTGNGFALSTWSTSGFALRGVTNGVISADPY